jgi:RNA polymerase sigma factor (sigma-70 family)
MPTLPPFPPSIPDEADETASDERIQGPVWIFLLKQFEQRAWDKLMRYYAADLRRDILRSLRKRGLDEQHVEDIEQETWLTAVEKIKAFEFQDEDKLYNWLRKISVNHIMTLIHKLERRKNNPSLEEIEERENSELPLDVFLFAHGWYDDSPENTVEMNEFMKALSRAFKFLRPIEQEILVRRLVWGETPRDMAKEYGMQPNSISVMLVRSMKTLRVQLLSMGYTKDNEHD